MILNQPWDETGVPIFGSLLETPLGPITVKWAKDCLVAIHLAAEPIVTGTRIPSPFHNFLKDLQAYLTGHQVHFTVPLNMGGMPTFTEQVLRQCALIPYGTTCSYQELAVLVGNPHGARAVGQAMGRNPLPIVIPCHRVLRTQGKLGGYGGGLPWKRFLLQLEGVRQVT